MAPLGIASMFIRRIREWKYLARARRDAVEEREAFMEHARTTISLDAHNAASGVDFVPDTRVVQECDAADWWEMRARFRTEARRRLREREGLPAFTPVTRLGVVGVGLATGRVKGAGAGLPMAEAIMKAAEQSNEFEVLHDDGLDQELRDLDRDAALLVRSEAVRHSDQDLVRYPALEIPSSALEDDAVLDGYLQSALERNK